MTAFEGRDDKLRALGFQGSHELRLVIGRVRITAGVSLRGFSLTFTEAGPRTITRYEVSVPPSRRQGGRSGISFGSTWSRILGQR